MWIQDSARWAPALAVAALGCADGARARQHDTMIAAVARAESDHARAQGIDDASLVVHGALDRAAVIAAVLARNRRGGRLSIGSRAR
jgi:hypothetical protein